MNSACPQNEALVDPMIILLMEHDTAERPTHRVAIDVMVASTFGKAQHSMCSIPDGLSYKIYSTLPLEALVCGFQGMPGSFEQQSSVQTGLLLCL